METPNINLQNLTKIPEKEFKKHFRDWMEQDDVARSLQAKLRKDLIFNFNKTSLGKTIIAQSSSAHRLTLSPLILALNTLVAEFLYAQDCHFTLSVFCTEVPYRNTLPDFDAARHFRFSEDELFEIFDAISTNWEVQTKNDIHREYLKETNNPLLHVVLRNLLNKPQPNGGTEAQPQASAEKTRGSPKVEFQRNDFSVLNKYLVILSKKVKDMSQNLELLQKLPKIQRKSLQTRKFENLNRSLEKISENLRHMTMSKRKNKRLSTVVSAIDRMAKQFEKCASNFEQINRGFVAGGNTNAAGMEKSYNDWIREMRISNNGKKFLDRIESSLRKALRRESEKMERDFDERLQIQKEMFKAKYKQKLTEELAKQTSRENMDTIQKANDSYEAKIKEFEAQQQEIQQRIRQAEGKITEVVAQKPEPSSKPPDDIQFDSRGTQTIPEAKQKPIILQPSPNVQDQLQKMVKTISKQERQVDHIVFDAKLRIQELEHESNQLDRSFREYLERQHLEKQKMCENATFIWQSYSLGKSVLEKKSATLRLTGRTMEQSQTTYSIQQPVTDTRPQFVTSNDVKTPALSIPTINIDSSASVNPSDAVFENPFRTAQKRVLARSKTLPPPRLTQPSRDIESSTEKYTQHSTQHQSQQLQPSSVFRLIEHNNNDANHIEVIQKPSLPSLSAGRSRNPSEVTPVTKLSVELNIKDITSDGSRISPRTPKSTSPRSVESNSSLSTNSPRGVFKLKRQLLTGTDNEGSSSSYGQQMNSNGNKEAENSLKQINKKNGDNEKKSIDVDADRKDATVRKDTPLLLQGDEQRIQNKSSSEVRFQKEKSSDERRLEALLTEPDDDVSSQSFRLNISAGTSPNKSENDFWT